jgi:predicted transcriptional regulator
MTAEQLSASVDRLVEERLATGRYRSREDVLLRALRELADHEQTLADVESGLADEKAGRVRDLADAVSELRDKFRFSEQKCPTGYCSPTGLSSNWKAPAAGTNRMPLTWPLAGSMGLLSP